MNKLAMAGASLLAIGVIATQLDSEDPETKAEVIEAAQKYDGLVELALVVYPDADVDPKCCKLPNGNLCRYGVETGVDANGKGLGGIDANGNKISCSCAKTASYLCEGDTADEGERVEALKHAGETDALLEIYARKTAEFEAKEPPAEKPAEEVKEGAEMTEVKR
jgi:hypothetical protein